MNKKIAILMYGQPRFLNKTHSFIKEEFDIPGCDVDYFGHFWETVGYVPEDEKKDNLEKLKKEDIIQYIDFKQLSVKNNEKLDLVGQSFKNINSVLFSNQVPWPADLDEMRYFLGQHVSIKKCFNLIQSYEEKHKFKYDIIVKARTDVVYKNAPCYPTTEKYNQAKEYNYKWSRPFSVPAIKASAVRIIDLNGENIHQIVEYYNGKFRTEHGNMGDANLSYTRRLSINDWILIANRCAADIFYGQWFETMLAIWYYDYLNKKNWPNQKWFVRSEQAIQGQLAVMNNIFTEQIARRDTKLYDSNNVKVEFDTTNNIDVHKDIQTQLITRFKR